MFGGPPAAVRVTSPGTPVSIQAAMPASDKTQPIHGIMLQALPTNTGNIYVGNVSGMDKSTYAYVRGVLAIPTINFIPTFSAALTIAPNGLSMMEFWIDVDVADDGVIVSFLRL